MPTLFCRFHLSTVCGFVVPDPRQLPHPSRLLLRPTVLRGGTASRVQALLADTGQEITPHISLFLLTLYLWLSVCQCFRLSVSLSVSTCFCLFVFQFLSVLRVVSLELFHIDSFANRIFLATNNKKTNQVCPWTRPHIAVGVFKKPS